MFADLERYKSLERDLSIASIINQFSGLVYVPTITYPSFENTLQTAGAVTINVDNATCTIQGSATIYPAYFIPGYTTESASLAGNYNNVITSNSLFSLFDSEVLITQLSPTYWYPNTYPDASWGRLRQCPFLASYFFDLGSSKTYAGTLDYFQYDDSGLFLFNLLEVYQFVSGGINNNVNVRVTSANMTYQPYTDSSGGIQALSKNTIINYIKRFPNRII
jgi:hypothetical protein